MELKAVISFQRFKRAKDLATAGVYSNLSIWFKYDFIQSSDTFPSVPNAIQENFDANDVIKLFLDFHGYLRMDLVKSSDFKIAYGYL